ncbi:unnamed protein product [Clonostachys byssicola]|uniref:Uncharacterized protein n=1 Tax=Clonostachys byssicola TaxID=160290 RepID=A0A9N9UFN4_9HYPO|nr:unnamed protein product [Clonostachys byssicola]
MPRSIKRSSLSEASGASCSTEREIDKDNYDPPPAYTEAIPSQNNDGVTTPGSYPFPELPKILKAGDTTSQHRDPELSDRKDDLQCTELPACGEKSAPEVQITPSVNRVMSRPPKRSLSPDASNTLPKPKRHEREPPGDEVESLRTPHITPSPHGGDIRAAERRSSLPDLCGGNVERTTKQPVDLPAGSDSSGVVSHPSLDPTLSSEPHLPPLIDESAAPGEPTSPVQTHTNDLASEECQAPRRCFRFMPYYTLFNDEEEAIHRYWNSFQGAVQSFARDCLPKKCSWEELPTGYQDQVREWASNPKEYLNSKFPPDVTNFYAAWLFRLLDHHLFSGKDVDKWKGSDWKGFGALLASGKAHLSEPNGLFAVKYHHWRNLSVQTLADMHHPDQRHVDPDWLWEKIADWMKHLPFVLEKDQSEHQYDWRKLIESAINMDSLIITARRDITLRLSDSATGKDYGFPAVKDKMARRKGQINRARGDPVVDFVIFPTLLAYGKANTTSIWDESRPAENVLLPFGDSWDTVSMELSMTVCYH